MSVNLSIILPFAGSTKKARRSEKEHRNSLGATRQSARGERRFAFPGELQYKM